METDFFAFCVPPVAPAGRSTRNTEKRRERSKVAARCRRGKESEIFSELSLSLPVPEASKASLDKASVMRLTLCDLKLKQMMDTLEGIQDKSEEDNTFESLINSAVSGFVLVCSCDGDVIYASEGISTCLGLSQYEVMGQSLLEYSHPCDQGDVREMLLCNNSKAGVESRSALFCLKSANSTRGRNVHHRTTNYKVVSCIGRIFSGEVNYGVPELKKWFVGICEPLLHPSDVDIPLNKQTFLSRHSPDMKFEYVDESITEFIGYKPENMAGKSLFDFYHPCDGDGIAKSFKSLYTKGQTVTERSRFLAKGGGWIWVVTQATAINNNAGKPTSVVCIHFVTSGLECADEILSHVQLRGEDESPLPIVPKAAPILPPLEKKPLHETTNVQKPLIPATPKPSEITPETLLVNPFTGPILSKPTPSTQKIFAPRTEDMDTGFLMPVNDMLIVTKEEPEDLTHLAPIAGDACVPLSNVPLLDDLLQWLDAADMEYTVLEGYEDPLPLPLIAAVTDSPIPMSVCTSNSEFVVKDDVVLESMPSPNQCDSPLLVDSSEPSLMTTSDPLLLSPFKTQSPQPSPSSCMDLMNLEMFSRLNDNGGSHSGGGTTISTDKCKDGGPYDEPFASFPIVTDFQEQLFSPSENLEDSGPPLSPEHSLMMGRCGSGGLGLKLDTGGASTGPGLGILTQDPGTNVGKLKYMATTATNHDHNRPKPEPAPAEGPLPCKVAKPSFSGTENKTWEHPAIVTPLQPPWKYEVALPQSSPSPPALMVGLHQQVRGNFSSASSTSITTGTQTAIDSQPEQRRKLLQRRLLLNPQVIQALMSGRTLKTTTGRTITLNPAGRKRDFLGKLLTNDSGSACVSALLQGEIIGGGGLLGMGSLVELTNQDCEVNAPLEQPLLDGPDLLTALDTAAGPGPECL